MEEGECGFSGEACPDGPPPAPSWSWNELTEEDQYLAYMAYLAYLQNPEYYTELYLKNPGDPELQYLDLFSQYVENVFLDEFLNIRAGFEDYLAEIDEAHELESEGLLNSQEFVKKILGPMLILGVMTGLDKDKGDQKGWNVGSSQTKNIKGYQVRIDWESPGSNGNVHVTLNGDKIPIADPSDLSMLPKAVRRDPWVQRQVDRMWTQLKLAEQ